MSNTKNLANLASVLDDGTNGQVLQSTGSGGVAFADAGGSGTTIHDTLSAMISAATPDEGTLHYNKQNDTLYVKAPNGFYAIATISNNSPTFDSNGVSQTTGSSTTTIAADGTFTLTAGTNTVVTINASDADVGQTLTFSATLVSGTQSDVLQSFTQGTGSNTNVFTLVPVTSGGGTVEYRFTVSDGTNSAVRDASFTIAFTIANSRFTKLLMATDNAVGTNQSITDSSSTGHTITVNNDSHAGSFSPYRAGGYSTHFNGSTDYLTIADNSEHEFDGDFSIEFFWKPETVTGNTSSIHIAISCGNDSSTQFIYNESSYWYLQKGSGGSPALVSGGQGSAAVAGQWSHVVLCRSGTTMSIFHNGTRTATNSSYTATVDFSGSTIGRYFGSSANYYIDGLVRDMRWLKGSSAYDATQSSITVPTEPLTAVTNTKLLLCHLPYIADGSSTGHTITLNGSIHPQPFSPYDNAPYSAADHGGSISFDGSDDTVTIVGSGSAVSTARSGSGFTIEGWYYPDASSTGYNFIYGQSNTSLFNTAGALYFYNGASTQLYYPLSSGTTHIESSVQFKKSQWNFFTVTYNGTTLKLYVNGVEGGSVTNAVFSGTADLMLGNNTGDLHGFISDFRISNSVVYSSAFTPPTSPLSSTGSIVHIKGTDAHILDKAQVGQIKLFGNAASASLSHTGFDSHSLRLQGSTNNHARHDAPISLGGPFTIEAWFNATAFGSYIWCIGRYFAELGIENDKARFYAGGYSDFAYGSTLSTGTWYHIALCRDANNLVQCWLDGTRLSSSYTKTATYAADYTIIGGEANASDGSTTYSTFNGYIQDLRITLGIARYTAADESSNIPSSALKG